MSTIIIPQIYLPAVDDLGAWATIACDQYTSDGAYWQKLESFVGDKPSTLNLIFPEIYLGDNDSQRIARINENMRTYLASGMFRPYTGLVLVERTTRSGTRTGILLAVDLEEYSFRPASKAPVRSTEATILERIPPRVAIRKDAPIELPHIMLLYDDAYGEVLSAAERGEKLYDFELNMGGGHVKGTAITNGEEVISRLMRLSRIPECVKKYGRAEELLFVVGDGNHSLAAAKQCWDDLKSSLTPEEREVHPARFALAEAVNIYDPALRFEPIHRFVKTDKPDLFLKGMPSGGSGRAVVVIDGKRGAVHFPENIPEGIRALDEYITTFITTHGGSVDYVHGADEVAALSGDGVGILLPAISKNDLFRLVIEGGNLPRKTFSMGDGDEKRYYIEAKAIK